MRRLLHHLLRLSLGVLLTGSATLALAEPSQPAGAVLTPDVGPRVEAAFARAEPNFYLQDAQLQPRSVRARVCRPDKRCLDLLLTPPDAPCVGQRLTAWCVQFPAGPPPDAAVLYRALEGNSLWQSAPHQALTPLPGPPWLALLGGFFAPLLALALLIQAVLGRMPMAWRRERIWLFFLLFSLLDAAWLVLRLRAYLPTDGAAIWGLPLPAWLAIWWLAPLLVGGVPGLIVRWGWGKRATGVVSAWLPLVLGPVSGVALAVRSGRVGAMDGAAMGLLATLTWLALTHARFARPLPWLVSLVTLGTGLLGLELFTRLGLPPPPVVEYEPLSLFSRASPRPDGLPVAAGNLLVHCALHASIGDETERCLRLGQPPHDRPWVLHLGDSMVFGSGVPADRALPAQLARLLPAVGHLNAGVPGTSIDTELAFLQRALTLGRPALVVLYVMPGNDADEVAAPTESCDGQPPLQLDGLTPRLRCPEAIWPARPWHAVLLHSRLPLPIAALAERSWLVRHLTWLQLRAIEPPRAHDRAPPADTGLYLRYLQAMQAVLGAAHVTLQVVIMPLRRTQYREFAEPRRAQLLRVLRDAGLQPLDTQTLIDRAVTREGEPALFIDTPRGDIHLNPHGLGQLAAFLAPQLALPAAVTPTQ